MATASIRLESSLVEKAKIMAQVLDRSVPKQIEHWAKIGEIMEANPELSYQFVKQALIAQAEAEADQLVPYEFD